MSEEIQNKEELIIDEVVIDRTKKFGNSCHLILDKRYLDKIVMVLVVNDNVIKPVIHNDRIKEMKGHQYLQAEITTNAGTHKIWIKKEDVPKVFQR